MVGRSWTVLPAGAFALGLCLTASAASAQSTPKDVIATYADIAQAGYTNSLDTAKTLKLAVDAFLAKPTEDSLRAARAAWIAARIPYMQTEAYRFGNAIVDDWEGKVNAWPLDEGLIDYVASSYGAEFARERALCRQRHRQHHAHHRRQEARHRQDHQGAACRDSARGGRGRGQCRHRLSRRRVSTVGAGPERHRSRQRQPSGQRFRYQELHQRQLRPPRRLSPCRHRSPGRRSRLDGGAMGGGRRGAQAAGRRRRSRAHRDHDRARQSVLRRAGRRAHEARPDDPRSRGGARLLLRQYSCLAFLRCARHPQRLSRHLSPRRPVVDRRPQRVGPGQGEVARESMPKFGPSSTPPWTP